MREDMISGVRGEEVENGSLASAGSLCYAIRREVKRADL
jgi:hypothetical protein